MQFNLSTLTREWIQYLKNNQIVGMQSNPKTGKLNYKRKPNVQELIRFLHIKTDFEDEDIRKAIRSVLKNQNSGDSSNNMELPNNSVQNTLDMPVLSGPKPSGNVSTWKYNDITPGDPRRDTDYREPLDSPEKPKKYSNDDAEDIESRDPSGKYLTHTRKPRFKYRNRRTDIKEDFYDRQGAELSEADIKKIFKILLEPKPTKVDKANLTPEEELEKKQVAINKLKRVIRDTMTPAQRQSLWRVLNEISTLSESHINPADAKEVFKVASLLRNTPSGLGKIFKGLRKDKLDVTDLQKSWRDAGFPDDTRDLTAILKSHGFGDAEINKVFSRVFGKNSDNTFSEPIASPTIQKIADYAKKIGIVNELKSFMQDEFGDELGLSEPARKWFKETAVMEEIRDIFTFIVQEDRTERINLMKQADIEHLGRMRK